MKQHPKTPKGKYMYVGKDPAYLKGMFFFKLSDPYKEDDEWKSGDEEKQVYMMAMDRHLQHDNHHKYLSTTNFGDLSDLDDVTISENEGEVGGFLWMGSVQKFEKIFGRLKNHELARK